MTDEETTERCWLVERTYGDKNIVTLVYATPDGEYKHQRERPMSLLRQDPATAAVDLPPAELTPVEDEDERERYVREAERLIDRKDPNEEV